MLKALFTLRFIPPLMSERIFLYVITYIFLSKYKRYGVPIRAATSQEGISLGAKTSLPIKSAEVKRIPPRKRLTGITFLCSNPTILLAA
ncbi:hypothetical protein SRABI96_03737 [Peribacillus sp. Bi96]|nr:hypothetical protein SRABI96_03737 [Peribacillus sp. Bi96]